MLFSFYVTIAEVEHGARRIASGDAAPHYLLYPANREVFAQKPGAFQAVLAALKQEGEWVTQNPAPAAQLLSKQMKLSPEVTKRMVEVQSKLTSLNSPTVSSLLLPPFAPSTSYNGNAELVQDRVV